MKFNIIIGILVIVLLLPGCTNGSNDSVYDTYDNTTQVNTLDVISIDDNNPMLFSPWMLEETKSLIKTSKTLEEYNLIGVMRYNNKYYSVTPIQNGGYLFILYEKNVSNEQEFLVVVDCFVSKNKLVDKNEFIQAIALNTPKQKVINLDLNAFSDECHTYHRFADGSVVCIEYIDDCISKIEHIDKQESNSVIKFLLPQDLELITSK